MDTSSSRRADFQRSYSSGRSSYVSEVSSGGTLAAERRPDSTYDSLGSWHRSSEDEPPPDTYSEDATDDEDEDDSTEEGARRSPAKRSSRGRRHHQERRRSVRDRRRGVRRRSEPDCSPPPTVPDASAICGSEWPPEGSAAPLRRPVRGGLLPRSFCPSSEPLRRKALAGSPASRLRSPQSRQPADVVRPRSSLSCSGWGGESPAACSPVRSAVTAGRESLEHKIERLRRQRQIVEAKIEQAQAEEAQRRQERVRHLADTLKQRHALLRSLSRYPTSPDSSPFREPTQRAVARSRTYLV
ncbi:hypothetical protein FJT64_022142 [Amphibalanus amphitrite]|uniref:Uncharacterized protein n=1 Tax=Amphibalanus amphitrite TaxID=1232801 RepID=A0A6A4WFJ5_AMPAM|nr:hypothetical protein FJT64_022142 [Amphibalanus amphitrite]